MAFNPSFIENLSMSGSDSSIATKASGKRKKRKFKLRERKRGFTPQVFDNSAEVFISDYVKQLPEHMKATTARNNDGMSYVW